MQTQTDIKKRSWLATTGWGIAWSLCLALTLWMFCDGGFYKGGSFLKDRLRFFTQLEPQPIAMPALLRGMWLFGIALGILTSAMFLGIGFLFGKARTRSIRSIFGFTALAAFCMFLVLRCESVVETGRAFRMAWKAAPILEFADRINSDWDSLCEPTSTSTLLPSRNSYPISKPTMCFFMTAFKIEGTAYDILSIERTEGKAIRFELAGDDIGFWIERRYDDGAPEQFVSGLNDPMEPDGFRSLGNRLFLVKYRSKKRTE